MNWIRLLIEKRKLRKSLGAYVSQDLINRMLVAPTISERSESRQVEFIWLWLDDGDDHYEDRLRRVLELGAESEAFIENILPPVVTLWFGAFPDIQSKVGAKDELVSKLKMELKEGAKLLHGSAKAKMGNVGTGTRFAFGALTGCRSSLLSALAGLAFGQYAEYENHGG